MNVDERAQKEELLQNLQNEDAELSKKLEELKKEYEMQQGTENELDTEDKDNSEK